MAIPWIKFEVTTSDKMEVGLIADILKIDPDAVVGKLLRVWAWFDENTVDGNASVTQKALQERYNGNASGVTKALLDRRVGVVGFCEAMIQVGWMIELNGSIQLPNFDRHNGESAKKRAEGAKRVEKHRNGCNAKSVTDVTQKALPDKIRSDKSIEVTKVTSSSKPSKDVSEPLADHGFILTDGSLWRPTVAKMQEWQSTFPLMDLDSQMRLAGQWLKDNPAKRKTERGMTRFLFSWLERAQNSNRALPLFQANQQQPTKPDPYGNCPRYQ